jgi:hypothetical protein
MFGDRDHTTVLFAYRKIAAMVASNEAMADELREKHPHLIVKAQLIYGLPGQTPATWKHTLEQVTQQNILPVIFLNEPLPASPALYDPEYQRKFQYEYVHSNRMLMLRGEIYSSKIPKKSSSFDQQDLVQMNLLSTIYLALSVINFAMQKTNSTILNTTHIVDDFLTSTYYKNLYNNLYHNWTVENNFYYTVDFSGNPTQISDLELGLRLATDVSFLKYVSTFLLIDHQREFLKIAVKHISSVYY